MVVTPVWSPGIGRWGSAASPAQKAVVTRIDPGLPPGLPHRRRRCAHDRDRLVDRLGRSQLLAGSVRLLRIVVLGPVSLGIIGVILIVERVRPASAGLSSPVATARMPSTRSST